MLEYENSNLTCLIFQPLTVQLVQEKASATLNAPCQSHSQSFFLAYRTIMTIIARIAPVTA